MEYEELSAAVYQSDSDFKVKVKEESKGRKMQKLNVYDPEWEQRPEFSWLSRCSYDPDYAYCILCKSKIQANIATLRSHSNSKKHKQRIMGCIGTGKEGVMLQILYDNEATVEETEAPEEVREVNLGPDASFNVEIKEPKTKKHRPKGLVYNKKNLTMMDDWQNSVIKSEWNNVEKTSTPNRTFAVTPKTPAASTNPEDEFAVFGRYIGNELRQVQDSFAQQTAKMKINTILFEALTGQYNRPQTQMPEVSQPYQIVVGQINVPHTTS